MLETLLESKSKRQRSTTGAIASVMTHTVLIAGALYATAQARVQLPESRETVRAIYFPPRQNLPSLVRATTSQPQNATVVTQPRLAFVPPKIDINAPRIDMDNLASRPGDFSPGPIAAVPSSSAGEIGTAAGIPFSADQVEKQVVVVAGSAPPRYPDVLRNAGVEGQVIAEFVVDEQGRAEERSIRFVRGGNPLFEDAVRVALRRMRFIPAEIGGRKVKQLVQMPFVFTIAR
jgi:periplasmic protein TonB